LLEEKSTMALESLDHCAIRTSRQEETRRCHSEALQIRALVDSPLLDRAAPSLPKGSAPFTS
jgi:hypothetical protein